MALKKSSPNVREITRIYQMANEGWTPEAIAHRLQIMLPAIKGWYDEGIKVGKVRAPDGYELPSSAEAESETTDPDEDWDDDNED